MNTSTRYPPHVRERAKRRVRYDNALTEALIGLLHAELIHQPGPSRGFDDVKYATLESCTGSTQRLAVE